MTVIPFLIGNNCSTCSTLVHPISNICGDFRLVCHQHQNSDQHSSVSALPWMQHCCAPALSSRAKIVREINWLLNPPVAAPMTAKVFRNYRVVPQNKPIPSYHEIVKKIHQLFSIRRRIPTSMEHQYASWSDVIKFPANLHNQTKISFILGVVSTVF